MLYEKNPQIGFFTNNYGVPIGESTKTELQIGGGYLYNFTN